MNAFWRRNNPKIDEFVKKYSEVLESNDSDKEEKLKNIRDELTKEDIKSQVIWISLRTCKGIRCKNCYIKKSCITRNPADSIGVANAVVKVMNENAERFKSE